MNPYLIIAALMLWAISLMGVGEWQHEAGAVEERAAWQSRATQEANAAALQIKQQEESARAKEQRQAAEINRIAVDLQRGTQDEISKRDAIIARYRNTDFGLREPGGGALRACGSFASGVAIAASGVDGHEGRGVVSGLLEFMAGEAARGDKCLAKLAACRKVVEEDRQ
jgi:hypothetical protein